MKLSFIAGILIASFTPQAFAESPQVSVRPEVIGKLAQHGVDKIAFTKSPQGQPFWRGKVMENEPVLLIQDEGKPDLVILAFGMNHSEPAADFGAVMRKLLDADVICQLFPPWSSPNR